MCFTRDVNGPSRCFPMLKKYGGSSSYQRVNGFICRFVLVALFITQVQFVFADDEELSDVHSEIVEDFPDVQHVSHSDAEPASESVLYLDVRRADEFAVSHLDQAIRVDPDISVDDFEHQFAERIRGKKIIFYCSVGVRSSELIDRLYSLLDGMEDTQAINLEGGIFRWHNNERPLYREERRTDEVHPFNWYWSRLLERDELSTYSPAEEVE